MSRIFYWWGFIVGVCRVNYHYGMHKGSQAQQHIFMRRERDEQVRLQTEAAAAQPVSADTDPHSPSGLTDPFGRPIRKEDIN